MNSEMMITKAEPEEYDSVRLFYHSLIDALEGLPYHPMWQKDIYPVPDDLLNAVKAGELYIGRLDERIAAAMVLNRKYNPEYEDVECPTVLKPSDFLCSDPDEMKTKLLAERAKYLKTDPKGVQTVCAEMEKLREQSIKRGEEAALLMNIRNLMETLKFTAQQAMEALKIPVADQSKYLAKL